MGLDNAHSAYTIQGHGLTDVYTEYKLQLELSRLH